MELLMEDIKKFRSEAVKNTPFPGLELLMEDLGSLGLRLPRIPPSLKLLIEDIGSVGLKLSRIPLSDLKTLIEDIGSVF